MIYVLDASAILRFTDEEPGFERIRGLLYDAAKGKTKLLLSAVNWGEIIAVLHKRDNRRAESISRNLAALPIAIVPVDAIAAGEAGKFKCNFNVPYADAFAGSLAFSGLRSEQTTLITADYDFKNVPRAVMRIEFLPTK